MGFLGNLGLPGMILILVVALIVFGPSKLPEIGKAAGDSLREFKNATKGLVGGNEDSNEEDKETK